jgi:hypothetical protein
MAGSIKGQVPEQFVRDLIIFLDGWFVPAH